MVRTFEGEDSLYGNTKQVSFAENGSILVVGSDHGIVEVFEVASGICTQRLTFPRTAAVQYVAVSQHAIISAVYLLTSVIDYDLS